MVQPPRPLHSLSVTASEPLLSIEWIRESSTSAGNVFAPSCSGCSSGCSSGCCCASTTMEDPAQ